MIVKNCLECGATLVGRSDKKFCDDQCRSAHNNKLNSEHNNYIRNVHNTLKRNRRILEELNPSGKIKVNKSRLVEKGFDFDFHTSLYTTKTGSTYFFCYEYGYLNLDNELVLLVKKQD